MEDELTRLSKIAVSLIYNKLKERLEAREAKDYVKADNIRKELSEWGIQIFDYPNNGVRWQLTNENEESEKLFRSWFLSIVEQKIKDDITLIPQGPNVAEHLLYLFKEEKYDEMIKLLNEFKEHGFTPKERVVRQTGCRDKWDPITGWSTYTQIDIMIWDKEKKEWIPKGKKLDKELGWVEKKEGI
jgi:hypothetical protein